MKKLTDEEKKVRDARRHRDAYARKALERGYVVGTKKILTAERKKKEGWKVWRSPESIERRRAYSRKYWKKMPKEEKVAYVAKVNKRWRENNWDIYYQDNRRHLITKVQNRKVKQLGNGGVHTALDIEELWLLQNGKCTWCLKKLDKRDAQVDHKIPIKLGGRNDKGNLQLLHEHCNKSKAAKHPSDYGLKNGLLAW